MKKARVIVRFKSRCYLKKHISLYSVAYIGNASIRLQLQLSRHSNNKIRILIHWIEAEVVPFFFSHHYLWNSILPSHFRILNRDAKTQPKHLNYAYSATRHFKRYHRKQLHPQISYHSCTNRRRWIGTNIATGSQIHFDSWRRETGNMSSCTAGPSV
jgi:hypothetical protein